MFIKPQLQLLCSCRVLTAENFSLGGPAPRETRLTRVVIWEHMDLQTGLLFGALYVVWSLTKTTDIFQRNHKPFEAEEADAALLGFPLGPAQLGS